MGLSLLEEIRENTVQVYF